MQLPSPRRARRTVGGTTKTAAQNIPRHSGAEGEGKGRKFHPLCLHTQHTVQQMITKNFNMRLRGEPFTRNRL